MMMPKALQARPHEACVSGFRQSQVSPGASAGAVDGWVATVLMTMGEPSLACETNTTIYRFLWLRTFHHPVAVRIEQDGDGWRMIAVEFDGSGGYGLGRESRRIERMLSADEERMWVAALSRSNPWRLSMPKSELTGLDGATWTIEARSGHRYRRIDEWSPDNGPVRDLGLTFLAMTGWKISSDEVY